MCGIEKYLLKSKYTCMHFSDVCVVPILLCVYLQMPASQDCASLIVFDHVIFVNNRVLAYAVPVRII